MVREYGQPGADSGEGPFPGGRDAELEELERDIEARMARVAQCQAELPGLLAERMSQYLTGMRPAEGPAEEEGAGAPGVGGEGAADGGENTDPNAVAVKEAAERVEKIQEAGVKSKTDLVGLYSKLGSAVTRLENIYEVKSIS